MKTICAIAVLLNTAPLPLCGADIRDLVLPADFAPGWQWDFEPEVYGPDNLYQYIDGEAELYIDYDFFEMVTASYALECDESVTFTLDIYDMGTALNAFGIYSSYRRPDHDFAQIGCEATVSALNIRFYKGKFFIQINAGSTDPRVSPALLAAARRLEKAIPGAERPAVLDMLPGEAQLPHSLAYVTRGFLGQSRFRRTLRASYSIDSGTCTAFVVLFENEPAARTALSDLQATLREQSEEIETDGALLSARTPYHGALFCRQHDLLILGVNGELDDKTALRMLDRLQNHIEKVKSGVN